MITLEKAQELLKAAVDTQGPDFVYCTGKGSGGCYYEPRDHAFFAEDDPRRKTACLVGVALNLAGETRHIGSGAIIWTLAKQYPDMMTPEAAAYFQAAQRQQDDGNSWGYALQRAEDSLREGVLVGA